MSSFLAPYCSNVHNGGRILGRRPWCRNRENARAMDSVRASSLSDTNLEFPQLVLNAIFRITTRHLRLVAAARVRWARNRASTRSSTQIVTPAAPCRINWLTKERHIAKRILSRNCQSTAVEPKAELNAANVSHQYRLDVRIGEVYLRPTPFQAAQKVDRLPEAVPG